MVDSDDAQIELVGEMRGDRMVNMEWDLFEKHLWDRCRARYASNTAERKQEKIDFFMGEVSDNWEDEDLKTFFEGEKDDFEILMGDSINEDKCRFMDAIIKFSGERMEAAIAKANAEGKGPR